MKIRKITIKNYRLLKDFSIDLEDELSLVIGKNNTGKTSLLSVLDKFLNSKDKGRFSYNDFNLDLKRQIENLIANPIVEESEYSPFGIYLRLFIEYNSADNLSNISKLLMDLDPDNNFVVLGFDYVLTDGELERIKENFTAFENRESQKKVEDDSYQEKDITFFLERYATDYFKIIRKTIEYIPESGSLNERNFKDLENEKISLHNVINFKFISAKREVSNGDSDKTLSTQTSKIYKKSEESTEQLEAIDKFQDKLIETDDALSGIYSDLFKETIEKVGKFGGVKQNESIVEILSSLQHRELLEGNTTVKYKHGESKLPESYNGLGYMNLISMIFEIEYQVKEFKRKSDEIPADINLLFIEEPEAHTHPQMQTVFIKNIKDLLKEGVKRADGNSRDLQYIISTHSSHIVSESDFNDIKYLRRVLPNSVQAKNLKDLEKEYLGNGEEENYRFLKQYLTLNRSELFFADKAILIEGDTERILLPAMMKKFDKEEEQQHISDSTEDVYLPLLSQNISIVEVGAHANIFERFINFLQLKTLIVTDIDAVKKDYIYGSDGKIKVTKKGTKRTAEYSCRVNEGEKTSNTTLNYFFNGTNFDSLKSLSLENKRFVKNGQWQTNENGYLQIAYQIEENGYHPRSFEDAFFCLQANIDFIKSNRSKLRGLKNVSLFYDTTKDAYDLAEACIGSKGSFAIDILFCSKDNDYADWQTPLYISQGLTWLKKD